jgi:hypothetical protein
MFPLQKNLPLHGTLAVSVWCWGQVAILLSFIVMVHLDNHADTAKLVFEFANAFWCDGVIEAGDLVRIFPSCIMSIFIALCGFIGKQSLVTMGSGFSFLVTK